VATGLTVVLISRQDEPFDAYVGRMRRDGEWGGHHELYAASRLFRVRHRNPRGGPLNPYACWMRPTSYASMYSMNTQTVKHV
jgi:hypothetical protein